MGLAAVRAEGKIAPAITRRTKRKSLTVDEVRALPAAVPLVDAGWAFGINRSTSYDLHRRGEFPVAVIPVGNKLMVPRSGILAKLGIQDT